MAGILVGVWLAVFISMIRAVFRKEILWPQKQEDRDEGGWIAHHGGDDDDDKTDRTPDSEKAEKTSTRKEE